MLPRFPNLAGFEQLDTLLDAHGHTHLLDLIAPHARTVRVLDGVWVPGEGLAWKRVDAAFLRAWNGPEHGAPIVDALCAALDADPLAVRRVVLYQVARDLYRYRGRAVLLARAAHLRIHPDEIPYVVAAALAAGPEPDRAAAESIASVWRAGSLARARESADRLDAERNVENAGDHVLAGLCRTIRLAGRTRDRLARMAVHCEANGHTDHAITVWTRLWERWADAPARAALTTYAPAGPVVNARFLDDRVVLDWSPVHGHGHGRIDYTIARVVDDLPPDRRPEPEPLATVTDTAFEDHAPPPGRRVRYLVATRREGIEGPWATTATIATTPDVATLTLEATRGGIEGSWPAPPDRTIVRVTRRPDRAPTHPGDGHDVEPHPDGLGFTDSPLPDGSTWHYHVVLGIRCPDGAFAYSAGRAAHALVHPWPDPVQDPHARAGDAEGTVEVVWTEPRHGHAHARWYDDDGAAPEQGTRIPAEAAGELVEAPHVFALPRHGIRTLALATRLGPLAVAGPRLRVAVAEPVLELRAEHVADAVRVRWTWPAHTRRVDVTWETHTGETPDGGGQRVVTRTEYRSAGVDLPIDPQSACRVQVCPITESGGDIDIRPARMVTLGPRRTVRYRVHRPHRFARDRRATVEITIDGSPDAAFGLVLLARPGREMPLTVEQGQVLVRLADARPQPGQPLDIRVDLRELPRPSRLRAFLDGPGAASCRLEHPSSETLLVT